MQRFLRAVSSVLMLATAVTVAIHKYDAAACYALAAIYFEMVSRNPR